MVWINILVGNKINSSRMHVNVYIFYAQRTQTHPKEIKKRAAFGYEQKIVNNCRTGLPLKSFVVSFWSTE